MYHSLSKYKKEGHFDILTDTSEHVTLVQLMDYLGNVNHAISVVEKCIFESNNEKSPVINRESLDIICAPSVGEEEVATFERVFCAARYIFSTYHLKK